jgi:predicted RecB family nuclease
MELEDIKGVGASAATKLRDTGIETVEELVEIDMRGRSIDGLSRDHVDKLRNNARRLLEAQETGDLTLVDGLGPSAAEKLNAHGVASIEDLIDLDLRSEDVEGLSTENLQKLKRNAEYLVPDHG